MVIIFECSAASEHETELLQGSGMSKGYTLVGRFTTSIGQWG